MRFSEAYPKPRLAALDCEESDLTLTITGVQIETLGQGKEADEKPVLYFQETDKSFVLNKTNGNTIAGMYGDEMDDWIGKRITLFATDVEFAGSMVPALRVRPRAVKRGKTVSGAPVPAKVQQAVKGKGQTDDPFEEEEDQE